MKDERAHLQLFDLIARDWVLPQPATGITFNANDTAVAFACADGAIFLATTADKEAPDTRVRRAVDTARLTIAPRSKPVAPLKIADFSQGRSSAVMPCGAANFAFAKDTGRINTLTPGGIAVHLPVRATGAIGALAVTPDGATLAYACGDALYLTGADADSPQTLGVLPGIAALAVSPDGQTLAVAHAGGVSCWPLGRPDQGPVTTPLADAAISLRWHPGGMWLTACLQSDGFCVIDLARNTARLHGNFPSPVRSLGFAGQINAVVAAGAFRVAAWGLDDSQDILSGKAGLVLINAVATCPTRNLVAVGYANGLLSLAEIGRPSEILLREDTGAGITVMEWSSNGKFLALAGADGSAALVQFPDSMFKS